jgi:hypothetical protein
MTAVPLPVERAPTTAPAGAGAQGAVLGAQLSGQHGHQFTRDIEHGAIRDHLRSSGEDRLWGLFSQWAHLQASSLRRATQALQANAVDLGEIASVNFVASYNTPL